MAPVSWTHTVLYVAVRPDCRLTHILFRAPARGPCVSCQKWNDLFGHLWLKHLQLLRFSPTVEP
jgi:hypothetical protein